MSSLRDRFRVGQVIGEGGAARVFAATDLRSDDVVAIKVLREELVPNRENVARFQFETDLLRQIDHPSILPLIADGVEPSGAPWFACALAAHGSLADLMLRRGVIEPARLLGFALEVLDALHHLHGRGIVHRDVKPENVLIDANDGAMLCDFGIALAPERRLTQLGDQMGTPSFMPPEQYEDPRAVTPQADLFGVGVTLFVALTGHTGMLLLVDHLREPALAALPADLRRIVDLATRLRVEERYATAWDMSLDVADALDAHPCRLPVKYNSATTRTASPIGPTPPTAPNRL